MSAMSFSRNASRLPARIGGLELLDFSFEPRCGAKGGGTRAWLEAAGYGPVPQANHAVRLIENGMLAMLGANEALVLRAAPWRFDDGDALAPMVYPVPRLEGTCWLYLCGARAEAAMACVCAVDLRARVFPELGVAQTIVARISAIIIREDRAGLPGFHILSDVSYKSYLTAQLIDVMESLCTDE